MEKYLLEKAMRTQIQLSDMASSVCKIKMADTGALYCMVYGNSHEEAVTRGKDILRLEQMKELLKRYVDFEAMLIEDNGNWWPTAPKDRITGKTYDLMLELQAERNALLNPTE